MKTGVTIAERHISGKVPVSKENAKIIAKGKQIIPAANADVLSRERFSVGFKIWMRWIRDGICGVSAVTVHRQLILNSLITDGEHRVFN